METGSEFAKDYVFVSDRLYDKIFHHLLTCMPGRYDIEFGIHIAHRDRLKRFIDLKKSETLVLCTKLTKRK